MPQPFYLFLPNGQFIIAIWDDEQHTVNLIHPFNTDCQLVLSGNFFDALLAQVRSLNRNLALLKVVEQQHSWLKGLAAAQATPPSVSKMIIGDELGLLFLEITDQCNERCIHCYASSSPTCSDFLSLAEIKHVLQQARALGEPMVQFTGGDPLIHPHLVEAVAFAYDLGFQGIEIYTNGLLLTDSLLQQLLPYAPSFAFSLYSPDKGVHDAITQVKGSHQKTINAMLRAQGLGFHIRIGMAIMEQNAGHEQAMLDFAKSELGLGKGSVRFDPVHETGRGRNLNTKHISLMPSQNSHMPDVASKQAHHQVIQQDTQTQPEARTPIHKGLRRGKLAVCANGNISPCIFNREHVLGNIRHQRLLEALAKTSSQGNHQPSMERWNNCQHQLSCADCRMVAYTLGEPI